MTVSRLILIMKNLSDRSSVENQNMRFMVINNFPKIMPFVKQYHNT